MALEKLVNKVANADPATLGTARKAVGDKTKRK